MICARLAADFPFPRYAFIPGKNAHPRTQREIHAMPEVPLPSAPAYAADLFHRGFFWEAHEVWERLWNEAGRKGKEADRYKALIHLAAAGVKAREGKYDGMRVHFARAAALLR